jgi:iron complex outermembrane recepter protein
VEVRSSTGVAWQDLGERYDATRPGGEAQLFAQTNDTRMIANETRAWQTGPDGAGWLAGFSYTDNRTRLTRSLGAPRALAPVTGVENRIEEATLYGEGSVALRPGLLATAGARVTRSALGGEAADVVPTVAALRAGVVADRVETAVLPSASLVASVLNRTSLYVRYQQGFRPGGLAIESDFVRRFANDRIATLETGVRHGRPGLDPFDLSASLAYTRWRDIQADFIDGFGLPSTANIGDGRIWTAGINAGVRIAPGLRLEAALVYNDSEVTEPQAELARLFPAVQAMSTYDLDAGLGRFGAITLPQLLEVRGRQIPNIAGVTARAGVSWFRELAGGWSLQADGWARHVGRSRLGIGPVLGQAQGDYLDSAVTIRVGQPRLGVTIGVTNLTDEVGNRFALGTPLPIGRDQITPLRPRTVRIGIDTHF